MENRIAIKVRNLSKSICKRKNCTFFIFIQINKDFFRPVEVDLLVGDYSHAKEKLGWEPSCSLEDLCKIMVEADLARN